MATMAKVSALILFIFGSLAANHSLPQTSAAAQRGSEQQPANREPATVLKATTRLVVVDVGATAHDKTVTDLERGGFTLLEDGKEQEIKILSSQQAVPRA